MSAVSIQRVYSTEHPTLIPSYFPATNLPICPATSRHISLSRERHTPHAHATRMRLISLNLNSQCTKSTTTNNPSPNLGSKPPTLPQIITMTASRNSTPKDGINQDRPKVTTIIFDVDDTLYDVGTGFTAHRNTDGATSFMVEKLNFPSKEQAQTVRDEYFKKFHSTAKGLTAAEADGKLPPLPEGASLPPGRTKIFDAGDLDDFWANNLDFSLLGGPDPKCIETFHSMSNNPNWNLNLVAFSNGPRKYVSRVLREIGLDSFFPPENLFAVTDVLPHCKPDKGSFDLVLKSIGARPEETIMVEDSMKNVRAAKALGMRTILVVGKGRKNNGVSGNGNENDPELDRNATEAEATKAGDAPDESDPAVDAVVEVASEIVDVLNLLL